MKNYKNIVIALIAFAVPCTGFAQDDDLEEDVQQVTAKKPVVEKKNYETRTVSGKVVDARTGNPISGAVVKAEGIGGFSVLTDDNGQYSVKVPLFISSLFVSYPDYNSVKVGLNAGEQQKEVKLLPSKFSGDYATESENILNTYSVNEFKYSNAVNIKEEIQNQLGGYVYSTSRSGTPGIGATTFIQGLNSLNINAQPLVVVDGVIYDQQYDAQMLHLGFFNDILSNISTADIESVEVLRNGTALYGARGANGVIDIKTKRSKSMATRITASASAGVTFEPKYYSMMNSEQYRGYASELLGSTGTLIKDFKFLNSDPNYYYYNIYHNNTDWKEQVYRSAMTQNYGIKVEGGDDVAQYNLSVGYQNNKSTLKYNDMNRLNVRFNSDIQLTHALAIRFDASFSNLTRTIRDDGAPSTYDEGTPTSPSFLAYVKSPFMNPYAYGDGRFSTSVYDVADESYLDEALSSYMAKGYNYKLGNPWALNEYGDAENKNHFENSLFNIAITPKYNFLPNLVLSEHFAYTLVNTNEKYYIPIKGIPSFYVTSVSASRENEVSSLAGKQNSVQSDTRLDWNKRYDAHFVKVFGGMRMNFENYTQSVQVGYNTGSDKTPFMSTSLANPTVQGIDNSWRNIDWYAQGNYNYLGRYFAQANLTASASSRFGKETQGGVKLFGVKWGIFPSIQGSWVITNEPWFNVNGIDFLRLTAGFDISGNDNFDILASRSYFGSNLFLNSISALTLKGIGNTELKWETTRRWNVGAEANFLNNRLHFAINYFNSSTIDLLQLQELSLLAGVENYLGNSGRLRNVGFDTKVSGKIIATKDWTWEAGATIGHYKNKITSLGGKEYIDNSFYGATIRTQEGQAANLFYGYKTDGVYSTTAQAQDEGLKMLSSNGIDYTPFEAGDVRFVDMDGNKIIDEKDRVVIGDPNPDIYGNIFTSATWKRFRLDVRFNYSLGNDIYNYMRSQLEGGSRFLNQTLSLTHRWTAEGDVTSIPKATFQDPHGNSRFSDRWIEDGSYLKLKSVTLSYTLPMNYTFLQGLEFWIQANNLFTITKYLGTDPEVSATNSVIGQGIDVGRLASSRSIVAGIKINL